MRRSAIARVLASPLFRWRYGAPVADELLLVPQELRTADPSFADECEQGLFGLSGAVAHIGKGSVFDLPPPSEAWSRELHGFGWLRHLRAAHSATARAVGRKAVLEWINRPEVRIGTAWHPDVMGRRIISWLANADTVLDDTEPSDYDRITDSLGRQLISLSASWRDAPPGYPRIVGLTALLTGAHCIAGHDGLAKKIEPYLVAELERQILADGGHVSRNPGTVVEILLDLLPLRTCFSARQRQVPPQIEAVISQMLRFVRTLRLGDGSLGRFNGMGATPFDSVATLLAYQDAPERLSTDEMISDYSRMSCGDVIMLIDNGPPPPLEYSGQADAGCLSFELSVGQIPVFVNGGAPGPAEADWLATSRATASHNTLVLGARSSAKLLRSPLLSRLVGGTPVKFPAHVTGTVSTTSEGEVFEGSHDGYAADFDLLHRRTLTLDQSGTRLIGEDQIASVRQNGTRLPRDLPFSLHFHLHPDVGCRLAEDPGLVTLMLEDGGLCYFRSQKATVSIEDSIFFADETGPRRSHQIVLRGSCFGDTAIRWSFTRMGEIPGA